ncbi:MAG: 1-deoxy-D-xylulose-5-phosphate reductoisomerase [Acidobacteriota bacterium]
MTAQKGISILGSTGSVGRNTLDVVRRLSDSHRVLGLAAGRNREEMLSQIREFRPEIACLDAPEAAAAIRDEASRVGTQVVTGIEGTTAVATHPGVSLVVSAIVGSAGLIPTHAAVREGRDVALANKEVLVVGGAAIRAAMRTSGANLLPVDSEHNALHQCLRAGQAGEVRRLILTASGGPFWERDAATFASITPAEAVNHPVWNMGQKISVDSATLMNKGLEVIEARWLFDIPPERIDIVIHRRSVVHSMVEFVDGSVVAQMGSADMRHPIQYALTWPRRRTTSLPPVDLTRLPPLGFEPPAFDRFPCTAHAYRALALGGCAPAALNGANEALVAAFLAGRLPFTEIPRRIGRVLDDVEHGLSPISTDPDPDLGDCLAADRWGRTAVFAMPLGTTAQYTGGPTP